MKTNVARTSLRAYDSIRPHTTAFYQNLIYDHMRPGKLYTRKQLARLCKLESNQITGRVKEMLEAETLEVFGTMICPITGKEVQAVRIKPAQLDLLGMMA